MVYFKQKPKQSLNVVLTQKYKKHMNTYMTQKNYFDEYFGKNSTYSKLFSLTENIVFVRNS